MDVLHTKETITKNMLSKYQEFKAQGYSENEAVGKTIAEFGNVDELLQGLDVSPSRASSNPSMSFEQVQSYLTLKKKTGVLISIGVALCILGATMVCLFQGLAEEKLVTILLDADGDSMLSLITLFVLVACAVSLFIYSGSLTKEYEFIEKGIHLDDATKQYLITAQKQQQGRHTAMTILGVVLCILSPISIFITDTILKKDSSLTCIPFLLIITLAVFLLVHTGCQKAPYETLLKQNEKTALQKRTERIYGIVNSVIILIATVVFLILGMCYDRWESAAIIYPVAGILCGVSSTIIWGITKENE